MERGTKNFLFSKTRSFPWDASPSPTKGCEVNNLSGGFILAIKQMLVWCGLSKQTKWEEEELSRIWVRASATLYFLHFFLATQHMDDRWIPLLRVAGYYEIKAGQPEYTYYVLEYALTESVYDTPLTDIATRNDDDNGQKQHQQLWKQWIRTWGP